VLILLQEKRGGFFVEFGAGDGVQLSNTYLLEKEFGWRGILAEPNRTFFPQVVASRSCAVDDRCVWSTTGETVCFTETTKHGELSTISQFMDCDYHKRSDEHPVEYQVKTISLNDLLLQHQAPMEIDYLSIDTEGSELEILQALDFGRWTFNVITAEHNFVEDLQAGMYALLTSHGYCRVVSMDGDDWYVRNGLSISARGKKAHARYLDRMEEQTPSMSPRRCQSKGQGA
jgi:FkbM family methyltransferase